MIYLAILLILCGLLIIIAALSIESGNFAASERTQREERRNGYYGPSDENDDIEIIVPGDRRAERDSLTRQGRYEKSEYDSEEPELFEVDPVIDDWEPEKYRHTVSGEREDVSEIDPGYQLESGITAEPYQRASGAAVDGNVYAVLFDDRSNIIDYEAGTAVIDPTFSKYKSLRRIGRGVIESDFDGVSFFLDGKFHRFDFHKVYDVWSGPDYIALPLKGNSTVKLFMIENSRSFPEKVEADYKEYEKGL